MMSLGWHEEEFSRDLLPVFFSARGHRQQFRHWQGCPHSDVVRPAFFALPTAASPTLQGALRDDLERLSWRVACSSRPRTSLTSWHSFLFVIKIFKSVRARLRGNVSGLVRTYRGEQLALTEVGRDLAELFRASKYLTPRQPRRSYHGETQSIISQIIFTSFMWQHTSRSFIWRGFRRRNKIEWFKKTKIRKMDFIAVGKASRAMFWPTIQFNHTLFILQGAILSRWAHEQDTQQAKQ